MWVGEIGDARHGGKRLAQELQPLAAKVGTNHGIAGDIAARTSEARHQACAHRIGHADHHDRDCRRRRLGCFRWRRAVGRNKIDRSADEFAHRAHEAIGHALAVAVFVVDTLPFDVAELTQSLAEAVPHRRVVNDSDARYMGRLLRQRR